MLFPGKGEISMHLPDALTIRDMFLGNLDLQLTIDFCLRLLLSCICGGAIGIDPSLKDEMLPISAAIRNRLTLVRMMRVLDFE